MRYLVSTVLRNLALLAGAIIVCLSFFEFIIFKYVLPADDLLSKVTINEVVRYQPDTQALLHRPDGTNSLVTINSDGWNSTKPSYKREKNPARLRIAVVGGSYVQGSSVDVDQAFPEVIERTLEEIGIDAEVFRFAVDGAPLSQYLHIMRREVVRYRPDVVLVQLMHNNFSESYSFLRDRYASNFLKVTENSQGRIVEIEPKEFEPGFADLLRQFRTFRYLYNENGLYRRIGLFVNRWWGGGRAHANEEEFIPSAVDIRTIREPGKIRKLSHYVLGKMKALAKTHNFKLAIVMDGIREAVYSGKNRRHYEVAKLNDIAAELTSELKLPFLDLQEAFTSHYAREKEHFEFAWDWHWNALGNMLVGKTLVNFLVTNPKLLANNLPTPYYILREVKKSFPPRS